MVMGMSCADVARRLGRVELGEVRSGFGAYRRGTGWILFLWASLAAALAVSAAAVFLSA